MEKATSKNGTYTEKFDGIIYVRNYINGVEDGKESGHYEYNGLKASEGYFKDGVKEGKWSYWHSAGHKESQGIGNKKSEGFFKNGEKVGKWSYWFPNGEIKSLEVKEWEDDGEDIEFFPGSDDDYWKYEENRDSDQFFGPWYGDDINAPYWPPDE